MNKHNIDVRSVVVPKVTADIDWSMLKDDQTTRDMLEQLQRQREREYREMAMVGMWENPRASKDEFISRLQPKMVEDNPFVELLRELVDRVDVRDGPYSWLWGAYEDHKGGFDRRQFARLEVEIRERKPSASPFERGVGEDVSRGSVIASIRGHGYGTALIESHNWRLSSRTRNFLSLLKPLIRQMGRCEPDLVIRAEFRRYSASTSSFMQPRSDIDLLGISLTIGDLLVYCDFRDRDNFDVQCNHIGHSVFHIRDQGVRVQNAREALLICNKNETMFTFKWDERLRNMMAGDSPTEDELLMMEMAGYKDEFWLDKIEYFDTLRIKPFNMMEQARWHEQTIPRFQF